MKTLDIILVTFNQSKYIQQALCGINIQRVSPDIKVNVIVADDCSADDTLEIIRAAEIRSPFPFKYLQNDKNLGIAENYKRAIAATTGDYIAILEGDDYWTDCHRLQKHMDYISTHTDCVITKNQYLHYSHRNQEWEVLPEEPKIMTLRRIINHYPLANLSASVYRGVVLRNVGAQVFEYGERQRKEATDWYITLDVMKHGYMYILNEVMSVYRVDTGENISRADKSYQEEIDKAKICCFQTLELLGNDYRWECLQILKITKDWIQKDKHNRSVQQWSNYISPCVAEWIWYGFPRVWYFVKLIIRRLIPNKLYCYCKHKGTSN